MSDLFWLTDAQMARLEPFFPKSHGKPRVDDRRVLSGIIFINRNGLRWRYAPREYGPHETLYNRWKRWSDKGIFAQMMIGLAADHGEQTTVMIDATYLKAHRTATSLGVKKRGRGRLIGRTKGGMNTKLHAICDSQGRPLNLFVTAGQVNDYIGARALVSSLPKVDWLLSDRGYDADWFREALKDKGIRACYPRPKAAQENRQIRQAPIQTPQPDRDYVWKVERLAACGYPIRQMPEGLPVSNRPSRARHLLAMRCCNGACITHRRCHLSDQHRVAAIPVLNPHGG